MALKTFLAKRLNRIGSKCDCGKTREGHAKQTSLLGQVALTSIILSSYRVEIVERCALGLKSNILCHSMVGINARRAQLAERRQKLEKSLLIGGVLLTHER